MGNGNLCELDIAHTIWATDVVMSVYATISVRWCDVELPIGQEVSGSTDCGQI